MIIGVFLPMLLHHTQGRFAVQRPFGVDANFFERFHCGAAQGFIVIHDQHIPARQHHVPFLDSGNLQIQRHIEFCALARFAFHRNCAVHGVHNIFCDGHPQAGTLRLVDSGAVFPHKGFKDFILKFRSHADAVVFDLQKHPHIGFSLGRGTFVKGNQNRAALRSKFHGVGKQVQQHLVEPHAVAVYIFCRNVVNKHVKMLIFGLNLRLDNIDDAIHHLPQGNLIHIQRHFAAFDFGHIQHVVNQSQQMLAGKGDFFQAVLHLLRVVNIGGSNSRHAHNSVHGRADIMAHIG